MKDSVFVAITDSPLFIWQIGMRFFWGFIYLFTTLRLHYVEIQTSKFLKKPAYLKNKLRIILKTWFLITLFDQYTLLRTFLYKKGKKRNRIWVVHFKATLYESTTVQQYCKQYTSLYSVNSNVNLINDWLFFRTVIASTVKLRFWHNGAKNF